MLSWLAAHYVRVGEYLLASVVALVTAILGAALPVLGLEARWPRRIAAAIGLALIFLAGGLALAKVFRPYVLRGLPWTAGAVTFLVGLAIVVIACIIAALYNRKVKQEFRPLADAAWRTVTIFNAENRIDSHMELRSLNGKAAVQEVLVRVRKKPFDPVLISATPGGGKTFTLMSVAASCRTDWVKGRRRRIIPVYIDVAQFAAQVTRVPLRDYVLSQISREPEFVRLISKAWSDKRSSVTWLFLFDNADQALMRWVPGQDDYSWTEELADFTNTNPARMRAVVAGRDLSSIPGKRVEIAPLNARGRAEFLSARGVTEAQQAILAHEKSFRPYIDNPGWLELVAVYLAQAPEPTPNTFYTLMAEALTTKVSSIALEQPELAENLVEKIAEEISLQIFSAADKNEIARAELVEFLVDKKYADRLRAERVIDSFIKHGLIASYRRRTDEFVEFANDSFRVYFLIGGVLSNDAVQFIDELLANFSSATVTISLLQIGSDDLISEIISVAQRYLNWPESTPQVSEIIINRMLTNLRLPARTEVVEEEVPSPWTRQRQNVLYVLEAGLSRRPSAVPEAVREASDVLLAQAYLRATPRVLEEMLDVQALAHDDVGAACSAASLRSSNGRTLIAAVRQIMRRRKLFGLLDIRDQMRCMMAIALVGVDTWTRQNIDPEYSQRLRLASYVGVWAGPFYLLAFGISDLVHIAERPGNSLANLFGVSLIAITAIGVAVVRKRQSEITNWLAFLIQMGFLIAGLTALIGVVAFIEGIYSVATGNFKVTPTLLTAYAGLWPICALYYLAIESAATVRRFLFPFSVIIPPLWTLARQRQSTVAVPPSLVQLVRWFRIAVIIVSLILLVDISTKGWHFGRFNAVHDPDLHTILVGIGWGVIVASLVVVPVINLFRDWLWLLNWRNTVLGNDGGDVLEWLLSLRTTWASKRLITILTNREPTRTAALALSSVPELARVLEWVEDLGPPKKARIPAEMLATMPGYLGPKVARWIKEYDRRYPRRLYSLAVNCSAMASDYAIAVSHLTSSSKSYPTSADI